MEGPLPECISSEENQRKMAEDLASRHCDKAAISSRLVDLQGTASITLEVTMEGDNAVIIQFRAESFDLGPSILARRLLGAVVPAMETIDDDRLSAAKIICLIMDKIPGKSWLEAGDLQGEDLVRSATSFGRVLARCFVPRDQSAIETHVVPKLRQILTMDTRSGVDLTGYFPLVEKLISASGRLRDLPGFFSHSDPNPMNIFVDSAGNVQGVLDWDDSRVLPFGMCGWCVHFLAGEFVSLDDGGIGFAERPEYEAMERGFWGALFDGAGEEVLSGLEGKLELVQLAIIVGTVLRVLGVMESEGEEIFDLHLPSVKALPKLLTYRASFIRGEEEGPFRPNLGIETLMASL